MLCPDYRIALTFAKHVSKRVSRSRDKVSTGDPCHTDACWHSFHTATCVLDGLFVRSCRKAFQKLKNVRGIDPGFLHVPGEMM